MAGTDTDVSEGTAETDEREHSDAIYIKVAAVLAVLTGMEVTTYTSADAWGDLAIPAIFIMMTIKFALVALFFMHLKDDSKLLGAVFGLGLGLATVVFAMTLMASQLFA